MSLAWTTVVLLVLLLPGFLFFVGVYAHERISRDIVQDSAWARLAGAVLVSFLVHGVAVFINSFLCTRVSSIPCIDLQYAFAALQLAGAEKYSLATLGAVVSTSSGWIVLYIVLSAGSGYIVGWVVGGQILRGTLRSFARHGWIYDLIAAKRHGAYIHAYVLTQMRHDDRVLMYRGFLKEFYAAPDGRVSYVVMKDCLRYYLRFDKDAPITSEDNSWLVTEDSTAIEEPAQWSYLMIKGEDIANIVFESYRPLFTEEGEKDLDEALASIASVRG